MWWWCSGTGAHDIFLHNIRAIHTKNTGTTKRTKKKLRAFLHVFQIPFFVSFLRNSLVAVLLYSYPGNVLTLKVSSYLLFLLTPLHNCSGKVDSLWEIPLHSIADDDDDVDGDDATCYNFNTFVFHIILFLDSAMNVNNAKNKFCPQCFVLESFNKNIQIKILLWISPITIF